MFLVYQYLSGQDAELQDKYGTFFPMVIASRDILQYETIRPDGSRASAGAEGDGTAGTNRRSERRH